MNLDVFKTGINAVLFLPVFQAVVLVFFYSPVAASAYGLLGLRPSFRLRFILETAQACLLCMFVPPPTVPLHRWRNRGSLMGLYRPYCQQWQI